MFSMDGATALMYVACAMTTIATELTSRSSKTHKRKKKAKTPPIADDADEVLDLLRKDWILKAKALELRCEALGDDDFVTAVPSAFTDSLAKDAASIALTQDTLDLPAISDFVDLIQACTGRVLLSGLGKSGMVARRMSVSLTSIGTPAHFVHAAEWGHGDLGACQKGDVVILFSHSGETAECVGAIDHFQVRGAAVLSITSGGMSTMARRSNARIIYSIPPMSEPSGGVPTASVVMQEAMVNGVINELISRTQFTPKDFKFNHPGGSLGQKLI
eukprot:m.128934 g.128934  ORF g.128934 m.128934 type:complete len:274 (-) comp29362_c0_seq1:99-920(-)